MAGGDEHRGGARPSRRGGTAGRQHSEGAEGETSAERAAERAAAEDSAAASVPPADSAAESDEPERTSGRRPRRGSGRDAGGSEDPEQYAREAVYRLLTSRARSHAELREALARKEVDAEIIDSVLGKFVAAGLVDDAAFAEEWVASRRRSRGLGRRALGHELRKKGIAEEIIASVLDTVDSEDEEEQARELVRRKLATSRGGDVTAVTRRLVGMLARRGYAEGVAFRVVREELEASGVDGPDPGAEIP